MTLPPRQAIRLEPPLVASEIEFLSAFAGEHDLHRVWPGQPSRHCPWTPSDDGTALELDPVRAAAEPETVVGWLRFLTQEFLAPVSSEALTSALADGLRGGHLLWGVVVLDGLREIRAERSRITERVLTEGADADVIDLDTARKTHRSGGARGSGRPTGPGDGRPQARRRQVVCVER